MNICDTNSDKVKAAIVAELNRRRSLM